MPILPLDPRKIHTRSIFERASKLKEGEMAAPYARGMTVLDFFQCLPDQLSAKGLKDLACSILEAKRLGAPVLLGIGGHVIKVGLAPLIGQWLDSGLVDAILVNGSVIVHDTEMALMGATSEEVQAELEAGLFGMGAETAAFVHGALSRLKDQDVGFGGAIGEGLVTEAPAHVDLSLVARAYRRHVPVFVALAVGTDILHMHPGFDPALAAKKSYQDFLTFAAYVARLEGGVYMNVGSAVILPEVFLKALALARNLGAEIKHITTANLDFLEHYRPRMNVLLRPTSQGGRAISIRGAHELTIPLLTALLIEGLK
jgi:hypothetical protein